MTSLYQSIKIHRSQIYPDETDSQDEEEKDSGKQFTSQSHDQMQGQNQFGQNS